MGIIAESSLSKKVVYKNKENTVTKKKDETTDPIIFENEYRKSNKRTRKTKINL